MDAESSCLSAAASSSTHRKLDGVEPAMGCSERGEILRPSHQGVCVGKGLEALLGVMQLASVGRERRSASSRVSRNWRERNRLR